MIDTRIRDVHHKIRAAIELVDLFNRVCALAGMYDQESLKAARAYLEEEIRRTWDDQDKHAIHHCIALLDIYIEEE